MTGLERHYMRVEHALYIVCAGDLNTTSLEETHAFWSPISFNNRFSQASLDIDSSVFFSPPKRPYDVAG